MRQPLLKVDKSCRFHSKRTPNFRLSITCNARFEARKLGSFAIIASHFSARKELHATVRRFSADLCP